MQIIIFSFLFVLTSLFLNESKSSASSASFSDIQIQRLSLEKLDSAALLLRLAFDSNTLNSTQFCEITRGQASNYLVSLHALIDEKIRKTSIPNKNSEQEKKWSRCEASCHCGVYQDVVSQNKVKKNFEVSITFWNSFFSTRNKPQDKLLKQCALKTANWFCKSSLLNYLKKASINKQAPSIL
jgi:hypothetical protein